MELDEMKLAWQELDARVARNHALNLRLLQDSGTAKAKRSLRFLQFGQGLQLLLGIVLAIAGAAQWATGLHQRVALVSGLVVQAYGIVLIILAARNFYLIKRIDYAATVLEIQRRLARLRAFRLRVENPVNGVACAFLWIPFMWAALAALGIHAPEPAFLLWACGSSAVGLGAIALVIWVMRRTGHGRIVDESGAGRSIVRAQAALDEIARFKRE